MSGWQHSPFPVAVQAGETKAFCRCGQSKNPPFCDGSHAGSGIAPHVETFAESKTVWICGCRQTGNDVYCDGSHKKL